MSNLYHGLEKGRWIWRALARIGGFFAVCGRAAYFSKMSAASSKSIVLALLATLLVAGVPSPGHAGSSGRIDAFVVRQKIHRDLPKINRCYESALRFEPELTGKVSVRFAVVRKGYVRGLRVVENTTGNDRVERCVARVVSAIRFPSRRTGKSLSFTFPFVFAPQSGRWQP
ncbi:MAG: AgmX/PglI C-terminal domain-containing protein [Polyangiales bacterium]